MQQPIPTNWSSIDLLYLPKLITYVRHGRWWEISSLHRKWQSGPRLNHCWITQARKRLLHSSMGWNLQACCTFDHTGKSPNFVFLKVFQTQNHMHVEVTSPWCSRDGRENMAQSVLKDLGQLSLAQIKTERVGYRGDGCGIWPKEMHKRIWWIASDLEWDGEKQEDFWHRLWSSRVTDGEGKKYQMWKGKTEALFAP